MRGSVAIAFLPSFGYRPGNSVQYALAIRNFDDPGAPTRLNWVLSRRATITAPAQERAIKTLTARVLQKRYIWKKMA